MTTQILISCICLAVFFFVQHQLKQIITKQSEKKQINEVRTRLVTRLLSYLLFFITASIMAVSLGLGYQEVSLFVSSAFAVLGVALFAQWSILSNITAGVLIFFACPYRIGEKIRIVDKDEDMTGIIVEISLFHVILKRDKGDLMTYPNSLMLQKAVIKLPHTNSKAGNEHQPKKDVTQVAGNNVEASTVSETENNTVS
ncbi:mechanosensitive ion channel family protein [Shewanella sp. 1_MG-2023]|uniref:mechanosensitive ion channel family protein n=1 Tax=unclassified Shewanella TaxID=196818 RepID=UPI000C837F81|nr:MULTISPECIES: mechanosensitive ion channel family protein [unclassified Shewanella]MDO6611139.1 mechanosensitive ion channel family protein [Shewanella sp. 7_MG-2023]MDO6770984.1 mechanosensitive ion channel family protein [Shewanella sp. 2_MG-2023]MDO6794629.1 mechanosensitive ion channel family protein [Shewanella sp. 1_MG-2023]PMG79356.1 mechanosensitive ion channel protein MscS [Shewanella sp. 10N.286.51.B7]